MIDSKFTDSLAAIRDADPTSFATVALARPDIFTKISPSLIAGTLIPGVLAPPRTDTTLPAVPDDVRPGDLIQAEDWNMVLARLRALDPVLANIAEAAVSLAARVGALERQFRALPAPPPASTPPSDLVYKFLGNEEILNAIAAKPALFSQIVEDPDVSKIVLANPQILEAAVTNPPAGIPAAVMAAVASAGLAASVGGPAADVKVGPTVGEQLLAVPAFSQLLVANPAIAEQFGVTKAQATAAIKAVAADAAEGAAAGKAGAIKAGVEKAVGGGG